MDTPNWKYTLDDSRVESPDSWANIYKKQNPEPDHIVSRDRMVRVHKDFGVLHLELVVVEPLWVIKQKSY